MTSQTIKITNIGDSIEEVHWNEAVKLKVNIMVHAPLGNVFICDIVVKIFSDIVTFQSFNFSS